MRSFSDIINRWKTAEEFAADIGILGVTARAWRNRNTLPSTHWEQVVEAAVKRGHDGITLQLLAALARAGGNLPDNHAYADTRCSHEAC